MSKSFVELIGRTTARDKLATMARSYEGMRSCQDEFRALSTVLAQLDELDELRPGDECPVCAGTV